MYTEKYAVHISSEITKGLYEAKKEYIKVKFKDKATITKFFKDVDKKSFKNYVFTQPDMSGLEFIPKNDNELFKIMPLIDKYDGKINK